MQQKSTLLGQHEGVHDPQHGIYGIRISRLPDPATPFGRFPFRAKIPPLQGPAAKALGHFNIGIGFVDEGLLPAYKMGRVFRLKQRDVDAFIEDSRVQPGSLEHLYPEPTNADS